MVKNCTKCGVEFETPTKQRRECDGCQANRRSPTYNRRRLAGLCTGCGKGPQEDGQLCLACRPIHRERIKLQQRRRKARLRVDGLCTVCFNFSSRKGLKLCERCTERSNRYTKKLRQEVFENYGNSCECCGEDNICFLTIDHINDDGAEDRRRVASLKTTFYTDLKRRGFPKDGLRVLCMNCNWGRRYTGVCPHKLNG